MSTATVTTLDTLSHVAIKGQAAMKRQDEVFVSASRKDDNLVIVYKSASRRQISPRKWQRYEHYRFVTCRRKFSPSRMDFWWEGVRQHQTMVPVSL